MRLIDADSLLGKVQFRLPIDNYNAEVISGCVVLTRRIIEDEPTIDAVPVVHGKNMKPHSSSLFECSECGWYCWDTYCGDTDNWNFCPNCGAKMDAEDGVNDGH